MHKAFVLILILVVLRNHRQAYISTPESAGDQSSQKVVDGCSTSSRETVVDNTLKEDAGLSCSIKAMLARQEIKLSCVEGTPVRLLLVSGSATGEIGFERLRAGVG
jgi:hypothetical protein